MSKAILFTCLAILLVFSSSVSGFEILVPYTPLPDDLPIDEAFSPGTGSPVGLVLSANGKVVILHKYMSRGHWAKKDLPVFEGDTIVTRQNGRIQFQLKDNSVVTMASDTKLMIVKSVHDPVDKVRDSLIQLTLGKVHFYVKKLLNFISSEFKVATPTATMGVRGSQWIMEVYQTVTLITTEEDTVVEVWSPSFPEDKITLESLEQTVVAIEEPPSESTQVSPETIEQLKEDLVVSDELSASAKKTEPVQAIVPLEQPPLEPAPQVSPVTIELPKEDLAVPDEISASAEKTEPIENNPVQIEVSSLPVSLTNTIMPTSKLSPVIEPSVTPTDNQDKAETGGQAVKKDKAEKGRQAVEKEKGKGGKQDGSKQGGGKQGGGKQDSGKQDSGKQGGGKQDSGKQGGGKQDSGKQGGGKQDSGKQGGGKQDSGKQGGGKQDSGKQDSGKQDGGKQDGGKQGGGKQASGKQNSGKQGGDKQDGGKQDGGKQDGDKQGGGKQGGGKQGDGKQGGGNQKK